MGPLRQSLGRGRCLRGTFRAIAGHWRTADVTTPLLVVFAVLWGISAGIGAQAFYALWTAEMFATPYRATAQGLLFFVARILVGVLSYFFPVMLASQGVPAVGALIPSSTHPARRRGVPGAGGRRPRRTTQSAVSRRPACRRERSRWMRNPRTARIPIPATTEE
jgi:hypothetical protein